MKVSVVMITYGHENYIKQAIEGVLMQEYNGEMELIISNDKSPDQTDFVIKAIIENHPKGSLIKYTNHNINLGMAPNFIWTLSQAKGQYIALCDGDDYWVNPLKLQMQIQFLDSNQDYLFSMGKVDMLIESTGKIIKRRENVDPIKLPFFTLQDYLKSPFSQTSSFVFRNNKDKLPEWFANLHAADQSLVVLKTGVKGKIKYHHELFSIYRVNSKSVSFTASYNVYRKMEETLVVWNKFLDFKYNKIIGIRSRKENLLGRISEMENIFFKKVFEKVVFYGYNILIKCI